MSLNFFLVMAVIFGVIGTLVWRFTRDVLPILKHRAEKKAREEAVRQIHVKYSDPLATSAFEVLERLGEIILTDGRDHFLKAGSDPTVFEAYKVKSTVYRLGILFAWHQALRRELFILRADGKEEADAQQSVDDNLRELSRILSDGIEIEQWRIHKIAEALSLVVDLPSGGEELLPPGSAKILGQDVDVLLDRTLHDAQIAHFRDLGRGKRIKIAKKAIQLVFAYGVTTEQIARGRKPTPREIDETINALSIRQASIYSGWQNAIGEMFLKDASSSIRSYDVIGYREFEDVYETGTEEQHKWIRRLLSLFIDIDRDVTDNGINDYRFIVLQKVYKKCGLLVQEIQKISDDQNSVISHKRVKRMTNDAAFYPVKTPQSEIFKMLK